MNKYTQITFIQKSLKANSLFKFIIHQGYIYIFMHLNGNTRNIIPIGFKRICNIYTNWISLIKMHD